MKKMISWNVNGLRACLGKGFLEYLKETEADIFCIQESKLQEGQVDLELPGYHQYWNYVYSVRWRHCHYCVSTSLLKVVTEY